MMNPRFRVGHGWILGIVMGFSYGTRVSEAQLDKEIDRLANALQGGTDGVRAASRVPRRH